MCGFDKGMVELRLKIKYPISPSTLSIVPLHEKYSMNALWPLVRNWGWTSTKIYVEQVRITCTQNVSSSIQFMQSFIRMMEHFSQFDHPPSQIFTPISLTFDQIDNERIE